MPEKRRTQSGTSANPSPDYYVANIAASGLSIYDPIVIGDPQLWIPAPELEKLLNRELQGMSVKDLPNKTRSKAVKGAVAKALRYPVPDRFKRTRPQFPGQIFDTHSQKANNVQVYNQELAPTRRYVIFKVSSDGLLERIKVVTGDILAELDTTGKLTKKYQARLICGAEKAELISSEDTDVVRELVTPTDTIELRDLNPTNNPTLGLVLPIAALFERLKGMVGVSFPDRGYDQERLRGADLQERLGHQLGYASYADNGQFPDVRQQLIEVKLQTSPTIDLGIVRPDSTDPVDMPKMGDHQVRHCDVRYALFYAVTDGVNVTLTHFFLTTGEDFFGRFPQCKGNVLNAKLQIHLPKTFFD